MSSVDDQINAAKAAAARDRDAATALSALKLLDVMHKSPRAATAHLRDPDLTAEDQSHLLSWLSRLLPRQAKPQKAKRRRTSQPIFRHIVAHPMLALFVVGLGTIALSAYWNTPRIFPGMVIHDVAVDWQIGGATVATQILPAATPVKITARTDNGYFVIRAWTARTGYATGFVPQTAVQPQF